MKTPYKIIWIDDQHDEQQSFIDQADREGFTLILFKTSREGMEYLRDNLFDVDAVVLDAKVFTESTGDTASERGLIASLTKIASLSGQNNGKEIPHVIFTGQPDLCDDVAFAEKMNGIPVFSKNAPSNKPLFEKLRVIIGETMSTTLRNRYPEAYGACAPDCLGSGCWRLLFPILASFHGGASLLTDPYNDLRKVVELVFRLLHSKGVIHERLIQNVIVNLQGASLFLSGKEVRLPRDGISVKAEKPIVPMLIGESVRFVLDLTQTGSHTGDSLKIVFDRASIPAVEQSVPNHHLLDAATLMTLDFIVWAKAYVDANPDPILNMANWEPIAAAETGTAFEGKGVIASDDPWGNLFVKLDDATAVEGKNVRIRKNMIRNGELLTGTRVLICAHEVPTKSYLEAISYRILE